MPSDLSWFSSVHFLTLFSQCLGYALLSAPFCRQISALLRLRSYVCALMSALLCRRSIVGRSFDGVPKMRVRCSVRSLEERSNQMSSDLVGLSLRRIEILNNMISSVAFATSFNCKCLIELCNLSSA